MHINSETFGWSLEVKTFLRLIAANLSGSLNYFGLLSSGNHLNLLHWTILKGLIDADSNRITIHRCHQSFWLYFLVKVSFLWSANGVESRIQSEKGSPLVHMRTCGDIWHPRTENHPLRSTVCCRENQYLNTPRWKEVPALICITPWWCDELFISGELHISARWFSYLFLELHVPGRIRYANRSE